MAAAPKRSVRRLDREIILGIDPGSLATGWGLVEADGNHLRYISHGVIVPPATLDLADRLARIYRGLQDVISLHRPAAVSLEKAFFSRNAQSALKLGQARGVALLAAAENRLALAEYSPAEIKSAVVGYGQATKAQVQKMVGALLCLRSSLRADAADALAAAICHLHRRRFNDLAVRPSRRRGRQSSWRDYREAASRP